MFPRRHLIASSLALGVFGPGLARASSATGTHAPPADMLLALDGKKPLIRRSFRPPNLETPLIDLRHEFTSNESFFVRYHLAHVPEVDARTWRLRIGGASVGRPLSLSLEQLTRNFERVTISAINQCSGNRRGLFSPRVAGVQWGHGAMGHASWTGVRLRDVLRAAQIRRDALEVVCDGADAALLPSTPDFVKSLPVDRALDESTLVAFEMNGQPLPHWNGAPARLVIPGWTATYWMKHLTEVRVEPAAFDGFWMKAAYRLPTGVFPGARFGSQETPDTTPITEILVNSLVTSHIHRERVERGQPAELSGWAWDGGAGIARVEISTDGGRAWREAQLGRDLGRFAWRGFRWQIDTSRPGILDIAVRARSRNGAVQPDSLVPNPSGYHHNAVQRLSLDIA